jgi:hypothetical protein
MKLSMKPSALNQKTRPWRSMGLICRAFKSSLRRLPTRWSTHDRQLLRLAGVWVQRRVAQAEEVGEAHDRLVEGKLSCNAKQGGERVR